MLSTWGDGVTCPCTWCELPVTVATVTADRLIPGGPYARWNIVPSCQPCNFGRSVGRMPEGCQFGTTWPATA